MARDTPRLFTREPLSAGAAIAASEGQAHYLLHVMRCTPGDEVRLFDGRHGEWTARLALPRKHALGFVAEAQVRPQGVEPDLWLAFAPLKRDATDLLVQKACELGVSALLPVLTERTNAGRVNLERLAAIAVEAAEQSERLTVPEIRPPARLEAVLAQWPTTRRLAAAIERSAPAAMPADAGGLLVGPEGGFSPHELELILRSPFISAVSLGPRVLRAETAAIAGLALVQSRDWQG